MIFIEDHAFQRRRLGLLDDDRFFELMEWLASNPGAGKVIPGAGGLRKLRWAAKRRGKRGGLRIIYFWWIADDKILFLDIYAKNRQEDLSSEEIEQLRRRIVK